MIRKLGFGIIAAAFFVATLGGIASAANKCNGSKIKATCKKVKCIKGLDAKACKAGGAPDPLKVQKCRDKFSSTFAKLDAKGGCLTSGDMQDLEDKADAFIEDLDDELDGGNAAACPNGCAAAKIKAAAKKVCCRLGLQSKFVGKGVPVDPAKDQKCKDKMSATFVKNEAKDPTCPTTGDQQDIEDKVDSFVADVTDELDSSPSGAFLDPFVD